MQDSDLEQRYYLLLMAAFIRGHSKCRLDASLPRQLFDCSIQEISVSDKCSLYRMGVQAGLRLHKFKRTMNLKRVGKVLGILRGIVPQSMIDIGTGRGAFVWPLLDQFPDLSVTCVDIRQDRVDDLNSVAAGGVTNLSAEVGSVENLRFKDDTFDVVSALEVLEHCPRPRHAIKEICRVGERFAIISVPSKPDDNPEHLHLFDERKLRELFSDCGIRNVQFTYVPGHIIAIANLNK